MSKWQKVFSDNLEYRAEIVKSVLEEKGLKPVLVNKKDSTYHFGQYEVHVETNDVLLAIKIITDDINF
tara:strand:- start:334 stop:537 length:204 start_codon:yes stop_codon:yes gene_type:complete